MTNAIRTAVTLASAQLEGVTEARLNQSIAAYVAVENEQSAQGSMIIRQALSFLVVENNPDPLNNLLEGLANSATTNAIVSLVRYSSAYKIEKTELADEQGEGDKITLRTYKILGKQKGSDKKRAEIQKAADFNFERFINRFNGCIWQWAKHVDDTAKATKKAANEAAKEAKVAAMTDREKADKARDKMFKQVSGWEGMSPETILQIKALIQAEMDKVAVAAIVAPEQEGDA